eukprot:SAG11_NODE_30095_length_304_cov_0.760976_1_plen_68_part_01
MPKFSFALPGSGSLGDSGGFAMPGAPAFTFAGSDGAPTFNFNQSQTSSGSAPPLGGFGAFSHKKDFAA